MKISFASLLTLVSILLLLTHCFDSATAPQEKKPEAPKGIYVTPFDTRIEIQWDKVENADSYNLYWDNDSLVTVEDNKIKDVSNPYNHKNLTNSLTYYYAVSAVNGSGESYLSLITQAVPLYIDTKDTIIVRAILDSNHQEEVSVNRFASYNEAGKISKLDFQNRSITKLPAQIGDLSALQELNLFTNKLNSLPESIGNLSNLLWLWLDNNKLKNLPSTIGKLTKLEVLYLDDNLLSNIPEELGNCTTLTTLYLHNNELSTLPSTIDKLANITHLNLSGNKFTELPGEVCNLSTLKNFEMGFNTLEELPKEIGNLTNLESINLHANKLTSIPEEFGNLTQLQRLRLDSNALVTLPDSLIKLTALKYLDLGYNRLDTSTFSDTLYSWAKNNDFDFLKTQDTTTAIYTRFH